MDNFKNFLIAVQNDFTKARASSDYQSALLAKEYGKNELLANLDFSVPRMKIKDVNIELSAFVKTSENDVETKYQQNIENEKIISDTKSYFTYNLESFVIGEKQVSEVKLVLNKVEQRTIKYSYRYIKEDLDFEIRISKLTEYFSKEFEDSVFGIIKEYREKIDFIYNNVGDFVLNENNKLTEQSEKEKTLDIEFNQNSENSGFAPVKININLVEDDLIWEVDKKIAAEN